MTNTRDASKDLVAILVHSEGRIYTGTTHFEVFEHMWKRAIFLQQKMDVRGYMHHLAKAGSSVAGQIVVADDSLGDEALAKSLIEQFINVGHMERYVPTPEEIDRYKP